MFSTIGIGEIVLIAVVALIVMGPEKFPEFAKLAMRAFRDVRGYVEDIKKEMGNELRPVKKEFAQLSKYDPEEYVEKMAGALTDAIDDDDETGEQQKKQPKVQAKDQPETAGDSLEPEKNAAPSAPQQDGFNPEDPYHYED